MKSDNNTQVHLRNITLSIPIKTSKDMHPASYKLNSTLHKKNIMKNNCECKLIENSTTYTFGHQHLHCRNCSCRNTI